MTKHQWDVFASHNRVNKPWVRQAVVQWRSLGLRVFFDEDSIDPGEDIVKGVERGLRGSHHIVLILSRPALGSPWVAMETACGLYDDPDSRKRRIIPLVIEPIDSVSIPLSLRRLRRIDLTDMSRQIAEYHYLLHFLGVQSSPLPSPPDLSDGQPLHAEIATGAPDLSYGAIPDVEQSGLLTATGLCSVEIVINRPFDEYTLPERERLLGTIGRLLDVAERITVLSQHPGRSVHLTIELPQDKAEKLVELIRSGALMAHSVTDACIRRPTPRRPTYDAPCQGATKDLFTTGEAAEICRVSQQTIIRCFDSGRLRGFCVPGSKFRRIPRANLIKFMRDNSIPLMNLDSAPKKVLIVDDDAEIVELISDILSRDGRFDIRTASSGYEAGMVTQQFHPDLILLDYMLPDVNGNVVCQTIRNNPEFESTRIIIISGVIKQGKIEELLKAGADDFVKKPFTISELTGSMAACLRIA